MGEFVMQQQKNGFSFRLLATNGETIATSELYSSEAACHRGMDSVCANVTAPLEDLTLGETGIPNPKFQLFQDKRGQFRFRLKARNGRIIATSQPYRSKETCLEGIESIRHNIPTMEVIP
jgi:uncharacterized protein YegP (UPF0339 family)